MPVRTVNSKFAKGAYDVINPALAGGWRQLNNRSVFISDNSTVGQRLTWSQAQAKAYRHKKLFPGVKILIFRRSGT